jgi:transaldolase
VEQAGGLAYAHGRMAALVKKASPFVGRLDISADKKARLLHDHKSVREVGSEMGTIGKLLGYVEIKKRRSPASSRI